jgi:cell division inhibitor SulA
MTRINQPPDTGSKHTKATENGSRSLEPSDGLEKTTSLDELLSRNPALWRGCEMAGQGDYGQSTGYPQLDGILPGRGWPRNAMIEIISSHWGMGELQLLIPLMRKVVAEGKWILWISPPYLLYAPALVQAGINTQHVLVIKLETSCKDALWSMEKALQTESCGLVLAWQNWLSSRVMRRLQLAAENGKTLGVLFHHNVSKRSQSSLALKINKPAPENPQTKEATPGLSGSEITVVRARGNFRPLSTRLNLYQSRSPSVAAPPPI